eukprot:Opistho-2@56526
MGSTATPAEVESLERILSEHLPAEQHAHVTRLLYGKSLPPLDIPESVAAIAQRNDFEIKGYAFAAAREHVRAPRIVRIGLVQNSIALPTTAPVLDQIDAIHKKVGNIVDAAAGMGVNVICFQEAWTMPFAFCTREKEPWTQFAEPAETGRTTKFCQEARGRLFATDCVGDQCCNVCVLATLSVCIYLCVFYIFTGLFKSMVHIARTLTH